MIISRNNTAALSVCCITERIIGTDIINRLILVVAVPFCTADFQVKVALQRAYLWHPFSALN
jgi:hypothetical protein